MDEPQGKHRAQCPHCWADVRCPLLLLKKKAEAGDKGAPDMVLPLEEMGATLQ